jgi:hypothetical protein
VVENWGNGTNINLAAHKTSIGSVVAGAKLPELVIDSNLLHYPPRLPRRGGVFLAPTKAAGSGEALLRVRHGTN